MEFNKKSKRLWFPSRCNNLEESKIVISKIEFFKIENLTLKIYFTGLAYSLDYEYDNQIELNLDYKDLIRMIENQ